eukprot:jgi/Hompol1/2579/HPOL_006058-RA
MQWTHKYQPNCIEDVLGYTNACVAADLADWLATWKRSNAGGTDLEDFVVDDEEEEDQDYQVDTAKRRERRDQAGYASHEDDSYLSDFSDVSKDAGKPRKSNRDRDDDFCVGNRNPKSGRRQQSEYSPLFRIVRGSSGCGKSALVYAAAATAGYRVVEMNASQRRSGKDLLAVLGEASLSHGVNARLDDTSSLFNPGVTGRRKATGLMNKMQDDGDENLIDIEDDSDPLTPATPATPARTLILIEDVDVLLDEDRGFWSGIATLAETSRVPIIMTCIVVRGISHN